MMVVVVVVDDDDDFPALIERFSTRLFPLLFSSSL